MLVEFSVTNFRSIRDKQTLSMVKGKGHEHEATHTFKPTAPGSETLLKSAAIYGANAAGKSNIIKAISTMRKMVVDPYNPYEEIGDGEFAFVGIQEYQPFKFCERKTWDDYIPTEFEVVFIKDGIRYQYGFSFDMEKVIDEWLFAYPSGRAQRWFEREYQQDTANYEWSFSSSLAGDKQFWAKATNEYELFLWKANNIKQLDNVRAWFREDIVELDNLSVQQFNDESALKSIVKLLLNNKENFKHKLNKVLCDLDTKVESLSIVDATPIAIDLEALKKLTIKAGDGGGGNNEKPVSVKEFVKDRKYRVYADHYIDNHYYNLDFVEESEGTKRLVWLAVRLLALLEKEKLIIIDELNNSFHPLLVRYLIGLFHSPDYNQKNAQLIFTTHETSVLDQEVFRRDQVWFCEKGKDQATRLFALLEFKPRKDYENLAVSYLHGRYGAIPLVNSL